MLLCLGITALVCLSVTIFSFQTKVSSGASQQADGVGGSKLDSQLVRGNRGELGLGRPPGGVERGGTLGSGGEHEMVACI